MTRFSERNLGSRAMVIPSSSIVCATGLDPLRPTKVSLRGSSLVATSAPKRLGAMRRPRPLTHGTAQAMVSPSKFCLLKTGASFTGRFNGNVASRWKKAGSFSFRQTNQSFTLVARKIFGAKKKNTGNGDDDWLAQDSERLILRRENNPVEMNGKAGGENGQIKI